MEKEENIKEQKTWVLIAEDDLFSEKAYNARFVHEGIAIKIAADGEKVLEMLKEENLPALILLDLIMPKKTGFQVLEEIKKDPRLKDIPVLILSNLAQPADLKRGLELGAKEYLIKPNLKIEDIVNKVKQYLSPKP